MMRPNRYAAIESFVSRQLAMQQQINVMSHARQDEDADD